jgi:hypothetical protein
MERAGVRTIPLTNGKVALVDAADYEHLAGYCWGFSARYARRGYRQDGKSKTALMHRDIMCPPPGMWVDHINGDTIDNRRSNLRLATPTESNQNRKHFGNARAQYKGVVHWPNRKARPWQALITVDGVRRSLGRYATELEAALAYDAVAVVEFGEFAKLNFAPEMAGV